RRAPGRFVPFRCERAPGVGRSLRHRAQRRLRRNVRSRSSSWPSSCTFRRRRNHERLVMMRRALPIAALIVAAVGGAAAAAGPLGRELALRAAGTTGAQFSEAADAALPAAPAPPDAASPELDALRAELDRLIDGAGWRGDRWSVLAVSL